MKLKGKECTPEEAKEFVLNEQKLSRENKRSRFNDTFAQIPDGSGKSALDYGCGWGYLAVELEKKGYKVDAIDLNADDIDLCKYVWKDTYNINFSKTPISDFESGKFDLVLSTQVIEHVHNVGNYLAEINRVLKKGGVLTITLPNIITPRFIIPMMYKQYFSILKNENDKILKNYVKGSDHINGWDPFHFVILMSTLGFQLDAYVPSEGLAFPMFKPFKKYYRFIDWVRVRNFSYTMIFRFTKIKDVQIGNND